MEEPDWLMAPAPVSEHETGTREVELQDASPENGEPKNA